MRFNDKEIADLALLKADREGRLNHKAGNKDGTYRERWFKLKSNLLFYYRLNEYGAVAKNEPEGVYVVEQCIVQMEPVADIPFAFSIAFPGERDKKYYFSGQTQQHCEQWVKALTEASYEHWRSKLLHLQRQLQQITGKDPLHHYRSSVPSLGAKIDLEPQQNNYKYSGAMPKVTSQTTKWIVDFDD